MMNGFMGFGWFFWIIVVGLVIWAVIQMSSKNQNITSGSSETPLDILKKRYAKGEITKEEYENMKRDLM